MVNGARTYAGSEAEGLLFYLKAANAVFDDQNPRTRPAGFDAEANTSRFIEKIPEYVASGILAFALSLQGGDCGIKGAVCSAFNADGSLRPAELARVARVIEACNAAGAVAILGLFNRHQDQLLKDAAAVQAGVAGACRWVKERGYTNVLIEVADQYGSEEYDHKVFKDPLGMQKLVELAGKNAPGLLVGANRKGAGRTDPQVGNAASYISVTFLGLPEEEIFERVAKLRAYIKPVVGTADDRSGEAAAKAADGAVRALYSWGFACEKNERYPFRFEGAKDDPVVYARLKKLTTKTSDGH